MVTYCIPSLVGMYVGMRTADDVESYCMYVCTCSVLLSPYGHRGGMKGMKGAENMHWYLMGDGGGRSWRRMSVVFFSVGF